MSITRFVDNGRTKSFDPWVNNLFDGLFGESLHSGRSLAKFPSVNVAESEKAFHVDFAIPGFSKDDFKISVEDDVLTVSGERKTENTEETKKYSRKEFNYTSFKRAFTLPQNVDVEKIEANYKDGILSLEVVKTEEQKPAVKEIAVK